MAVFNVDVLTVESNITDFSIVPLSIVEFSKLEALMDAFSRFEFVIVDKRIVEFAAVNPSALVFSILE